MMSPELGVGVEKSGSEYLWIEGKVTHGHNGTEYVPLEHEESAMVKLYLTDAALPNTKRDLERLGFNGDFETPRLSDENMRRIAVFAKHDEYKGKPQVRWGVREPGGAKMAADPSVKKSLNDRYRQSSAPTPSDPNEIPF